MPYIEVSANIAEKKKEYRLKNKRAADENIILLRKLKKIDLDLSLDSENQSLLQDRRDTIDKIVRKNDGLIWDQIRKLGDVSSLNQTAMEDLHSEGVVGLLHAIEKFKFDKGNQFSTYASTCVFGYLRKYINKSQIIPLPSHVVGHFTAARRGQTQYYNPKREVYEDIDPTIVSLSKGSCYIDEYYSQYETVVGTSPGIDDGIISNLFFKTLLDDLTERERYVVNMLYVEEISIADIANLMDMKYQIVIDIYISALRRIAKKIMSIDGINIKDAAKCLKLFDDNARVVGLPGVKNILINHCDDSPFRNRTIADYIYSIIRSSGAEGIEISEIYEIINMHVGSDRSKKVKQLLNSWIISPGSEWNFKLAYSVFPKIGRPEKDSDVERYAIIGADDAYPSWHVSDVRDEIGGENFVEENNFLSPFDGGTVANAVYCVLVRYRGIGIPVSDLVGIVGIQNRKKIESIIRSWLSSSSKNGFSIAYDRYPLSSQKDLVGRSRISIVYAGDPFPLWSLAAKKQEKVGA